jgi:sialate O-acetylesterase
MLLAYCLAAVSIAQPGSEFRTASVFGDNMVLQRYAPVPIWGTARPGSIVNVTIRGKTEKGVATASGRWQVVFNNLIPGNAGDVTFVSGEERIVYKNVAVGDVWFCSGQSNMEWPVFRSKNSAVEIATARNPSLRMFTVARNPAVGWLGEVAGEWVPTNSNTAPFFSAAAYFFGRAIQKTEGVPIGLIVSAYGGTPLSSWAPKEALLLNPVSSTLVSRYEAAVEKVKARDPKLFEILTNPYEYTDDPRNQGEESGWHKELRGEALELWRTEKMPARFQDISYLRLSNVVWFRRDFEVPSGDLGSALISLGPIDDYDIVYINGEKVGETLAGTPDANTIPRSYTIPAGILKPGTNTIAVRIHNAGGAGGFLGFPDQMTIRIAGSRIALDGPWLVRQETARRGYEEGFSPRDQFSPSSLWDGMIRPIIPYGITGMIWYQGETDVQDPKTYSVLFPDFVQAIRREWRRPNLPFIYAELANYLARREAPPVKSEWGELREAQSQVLKLPNTGFAVSIDIGEEDDIHPKDKQTLGFRLAMAARTLVYPGKIPSGLSPRFSSWTRVGRRAIVQFQNARNLETSSGRVPRGFAVRKARGPWRWADATIVGTTVLLSHPEIEFIDAVRYGWADNPDVNLVNEKGLPASPFRTDND